MNRHLFSFLLLLSQLDIKSVFIHGFSYSSTTKSSSSVLLAERSQGSDDKDRRVPWEFGRFLQQSSKFVTLPNPFYLPRNKLTIKPGDVIWSSGSKSNRFTFSPLDDVVMGGASQSTFDKETGIWKGTVTSANNGGFVGIRSTPLDQPLDMSKCTGLQIKYLGGEGRRFKATVRDSSEFNGVAWTSSFDTKPLPSVPLNAISQLSLFSNGGGGVTTVKIPFSKLIPTIFARTVPNKVFNKDNIQAIQLTYSKFEYDEGLNPNFKLGPFSLQVIEVSGY